MSKNLTRAEVIEFIRPHGKEGDRKIHETFRRQTILGEPSLNRREIKLLIYAALDRDKVSGREIRCLRKILDYEHIRNDAHRYLVNFMWLSAMFYERHWIFSPMPSWIEEQQINVIADASQIPLQFTLPDKPNYIYYFRSLETVARLLRAGLMTQFYYRRPGVTNPGFYSFYSDSLAFSEHAAVNQHEHKSTVVHESTHTLQDMFGWSADIGHKEAAAHIVQAVWLLRHRKLLHGRLAKPAISDLAEQMTDALSRPGVWLFNIDKGTYSDIRDVLAADHYRVENAATSNGLDLSVRRMLFA